MGNKDQLSHLMIDAEKPNSNPELEPIEVGDPPRGIAREIAEVLSRNRTAKKSIAEEMVAQGIPHDAAERLLNLSKKGDE